ncbi:MAG TPA: prepilin-type N-terminal cleavage/methylation domain-containing protein [Lacunisphaera sp.]|nr:prepilin-type N-terminal cleavage/methylation domain-containing protein [Lacunisphaera sp.]
MKVNRHDGLFDSASITRCAQGDIGARTDSVSDWPRPGRQAHRGGGAFTLIEVLVALAIFALSGIVLASAYVNVLNAHAAALHRDDYAADRKLVREALMAEPSLDKVTAWNELALPDERTARWRATVTPAPVADLFDAVVEVEFTDANGRRAPTITESCRLLRPTWSQPADRDTLRAAARSKLAQRTFQ